MQAYTDCIPDVSSSVGLSVASGGVKCAVNFSCTLFLTTQVKDEDVKHFNASERSVLVV
jgi:hypothetical protein